MQKKNKNNDIYTTIGRNIQKIRKKKGYSVQELSDLCNLSFGYIKNLESPGVRATISIETLSYIAEKLECDLLDLIQK